MRGSRTRIVAAIALAASLAAAGCTSAQQTVTGTGSSTTGTRAGTSTTGTGVTGTATPGTDPGGAPAANPADPGATVTTPVPGAPTTAGGPTTTVPGGPTVPGAPTTAPPTTAGPGQPTTTPAPTTTALTTTTSGYSPPSARIEGTCAGASEPYTVTYWRRISGGAGWTVAGNPLHFDEQVLSGTMAHVHSVPVTRTSDGSSATVLMLPNIMTCTPGGPVYSTM